MTRTLGPLVTLVLLLSACGGADSPADEGAVQPAPQLARSAGGETRQASPEPPPPNPDPWPGRTGRGNKMQDPVSACGAMDSYEFIASEFQCPEGGNPLGGDAMAGQRARAGNVGANQTGHIIDHYVIPCRTGEVSMYVDMYACPDMQQKASSRPVGSE